MTEELERDQRVGRKVRALLTDDTVASVFANLEQRYHSAWLAAETVSDREACWAKRRALEDLRNELQTFVNDGEQAAINLERLKAGKPRL